MYALSSILDCNVRLYRSTLTGKIAKVWEIDNSKDPTIEILLHESHFVLLRPLDIDINQEGQVSKALWTTDTIETILAHFPNDERSILACINRIWASTVKRLQQYRQQIINRWFSLLQNFYTWRGHTADKKIMRSLPPAAKPQEDGSNLITAQRRDPSLAPCYSP
jgi:hypothetical protein